MKSKRAIPFALAVMMLLAMLSHHSALGIGLVTLNVSPQKQVYSVGETVTVSIPDNGYSQTAIYVVAPDSNYQTVNNGSAITLNQAGTWALRGYALTADGEKLYTPENVLLEVEGKNDEGDGFIAKPDLSDKNPNSIYRIQQPSDGAKINLWDNQPVQLKWDTYPGADYYIVEVLFVEENFSHTFSYKHANVAGQEVQEMSITTLQEDAKKCGANFLIGGSITITITAYKE